MESIVELFQKHGVWTVLGAALLFLVVKIVPELWKYIQNKKEREDEAALAEKQITSVYVVFGVDDNKDVWMYSLFKSKEEAEVYILTIKSVVDDGIVLLYNECHFNQPIKGFEAYNPYSQKYFGTSRCVADIHISQEKTSPSNHAIHSSSANSYEKIKSLMENKSD